MSTFATTRIFSAAPDQVFAAFQAPARLATWWGPDGFRTTIDHFDFTPGGIWRFTMHGPDGSNYPNEATFLSVKPSRDIIIKHISQPHFLLSITLEAAALGTLVTWVQVFENPEIAAAIKHIVEPANEQNLNRWQAAVESA